MDTETSMTTAATASDGRAMPRLLREPDGKLTLVPDGGGQSVSDCRVARCFPWSLPDRFLSVRDKDGNELHLFGSLDEVPDGTRQVLIDELAAQEFVPKILRVHEIDDSFEIVVWQADTDRGPVEFQVKDDEDIRVLGDSQVLVKDHNGMLFEIPNLEAMDEASRTLIEDRLS